MAKPYLLKSTFRGRLGDVIGAEWRGVEYWRTYTKPKQPKTPAQLEHYRRFRILILIANSLYKIWLPKCFEDIKEKTLSNQFMSLNKGIFSGDVPGFFISLNGDAPVINANWSLVNMKPDYYEKTFAGLQGGNTFDDGDEFLDIQYFYDDKEIYTHIFKSVNETLLWNFTEDKTNHPYIWIQQTFHDGILRINRCGWSTWKPS